MPYKDPEMRKANGRKQYLELRSNPGRWAEKLRKHSEWQKKKWAEDAEWRTNHSEANRANYRERSVERVIAERERNRIGMAKWLKASPDNANRNREKVSMWRQKKKASGEWDEIKRKIIEANIKRYHEVYKKDPNWVEKENAKHRAYGKTEHGRYVKNYNCNKRRERLHCVVHAFSVEEWLDKIDLCGGICPVCNQKMAMTMDHTYPLKRAHEDFLQTGVKRIYTIDDVTPMCKSCNTSKYDKV